MTAEKLMVELIRRGATLLKEPCPKCGGLTVKYRGRIICPTCSKAKTVKEIEEEFIPKEKLTSTIIEVIELRIHELIKKIKNVNTIREEKEIVELISLYYKLLNEIQKQLGSGKK